MKKKYLILVLAVAAVAAAGAGTSLALHTDESARLVNTISEKTLGVTEKSKIQDEIKVNPGSAIDLNYSVFNDGGSDNTNGSYDIYAKVFVYYGFENVQTDKDSPVQLNIDVDGEPIRLDKYIYSYDDQYRAGDWIVTYFDDEQIVLYYTKPLAYGETSSEFLSSMKFDKDMGNEFSGQSFLIESSVDAVQTNCGKSAIAAEWGVYPDFDGNGNITYISEEL